MTYTTTITSAELGEHLTDPKWVVLDARFDLEDESLGAQLYAESHVPGAHYADLGRHMAGPIIPGVTGRRPFPDAGEFARTLTAWGIDDDTHVVVYDGQSGMMAGARLWLMLRWMGHDAVAVLDGGFAAWTQAGMPVTSEPSEPAVREAPFAPRVRSELLADVAEVEVIRADPTFRLLDARSELAFHGQGPAHDPKVGHIPGAISCDRAATTGADGHFKSADELREQFLEVMGEVPIDRVVVYCGSGVTAAQNVLAMEIAGLSGARMYVGSWSEWITNPDHGVAL
ncbi:MAG: sulfurtransferase [Actinobacteria bacterium]|nr:sulfurtransferase [Actinomycetota bacterium]